MKLYHTRAGILLESGGKFYLHDADWDTFINQDNLVAVCDSLAQKSEPLSNAASLVGDSLLPPLKSQELWACGVTYFRSKVGRQEESKDAGGGDFYGRVYEARRPEVFFKATPHRVVGHGGLVNIRKDSTWDVPEPELTLVVNRAGKIVGYTIGNDMSSRSIEGENPLYLPQAKTYDACAAVGPCVLVTDKPLPSSTAITLTIERGGQVVFEGNTGIDQMKRTPEELVSFVYHSCSFPVGALIMTGTGIVPGNDFTLKSGDVIHIRIDGIGVLTNTVR